MAQPVHHSTYLVKLRNGTDAKTQVVLLLMCNNAHSGQIHADIKEIVTTPSRVWQNMTDQDILKANVNVMSFSGSNHKYHRTEGDSLGDQPDSARPHPALKPP